MLKINFEAGESRYGDYGVNFMSTLDEDPRVTGYPLYAECKSEDAQTDEYGYFALKASIIKQAAAYGIPKSELSFWYDGQENFLSDEARADVPVDA